MNYVHIRTIMTYAPGIYRSLTLAFAVAFLSALVAVPENVHAQTPVTQIENAAGDSVLTVFEDGGFAAYGEEGTGTIPVEGAGTRLMWHPAKAAFRAGEVGELSPASEEFWDDDNVGAHSVAFGKDTQASGVNSVAMGDRTTASGANATAMGSQTTASGGISTAMGTGTEASGVSTTAMGSDTRASGNYSTAMGDRTEAATEASLTIGTYNDANDGTADNSLFVAGNGSGALDRSDALALDFDGNMTLAGSLNENSDRRLKEEIQSLGTDALDKLGQIRPVQFHFKNKETHPSGEQIGLIAQEVQAQFPQLVNEGTSGHLSVSYSKFTAVLLKGLQEQQSTVDSLKGRIQRLEQQKQDLDHVKKRLAQLESDTDRSVLAGLTGSSTGLLLAVLLGGLLGAGLLWRRRASTAE
ncbi:MAG: tail fiber domain-containing protein [Salinivenus sp.]